MDRWEAQARAFTGGGGLAGERSRALLQRYSFGDAHLGPFDVVVAAHRRFLAAHGAAPTEGQLACDAVHLLGDDAGVGCRQASVEGSGGGPPGCG